MLDAAVRAPSGSNAQSWRWLVVTNRETVAAMAVLYREAWQHLNDTVYAGVDRTSDPTLRRVVGSASWLAENFEQVPLIVLPFHRNDPSGSSIYPAVWNLMLAARGQGVGTTLTTVLGAFKGKELGELLDVPEGKGWVERSRHHVWLPAGELGGGQATSGSRSRARRAMGPGAAVGDTRSDVEAGNMRRLVMVVLPRAACCRLLERSGVRPRSQGSDRRHRHRRDTRRSAGLRSPLRHVRRCGADRRRHG